MVSISSSVLPLVSLTMFQLKKKLIILNKANIQTINRPAVIVAGLFYHQFPEIHTTNKPNRCNQLPDKECESIFDTF